MTRDNRKAQQEESLLHSVNNLRLIPDPQWKANADSPKFFSNLQMSAVALMCPHITHTPIINKIM